MEFALLLLLSAKSLLIFTRFFCIFSINSISLFLDLALSCLLPLLLLQFTNEPVSLNIDTLEALPNTVGHTFKVRTEQMVRFLTVAAVDEIARILAFETVFRVLITIYSKLDYEFLFQPMLEPDLK